MDNVDGGFSVSEMRGGNPMDWSSACGFSPLAWVQANAMLVAVIVVLVWWFMGHPGYKMVEKQPKNTFTSRFGMNTASQVVRRGDNRIPIGRLRN